MPKKQPKIKIETAKITLTLPLDLLRPLGVACNDLGITVDKACEEALEIWLRDWAYKQLWPYKQLIKPTKKQPKGEE